MAGAGKDARRGRRNSAGFREDPPVIYLQASHVIAFTLPLHETVDQQWRNGEMQRVSEDGGPYEGDQYDLSGAYDIPAEDAPSAAAAPAAAAPPAAPPGPARPADSAPLKAWQDYAAAIGACTQEEAAAMTRPGLITKCTPPEMRPTAPGA